MTVTETRYEADFTESDNLTIEVKSATTGKTYWLRYFWEAGKVI